MSTSSCPLAVDLISDSISLQRNSATTDIYKSLDKDPDKQVTLRSDAEDNEPGSAGDAMINFLSDEGSTSDSNAEDGMQQAAKPSTLISRNGPGPRKAGERR